MGKDVLYNTISTPRGGQYKLILPDGSRVWLNAASALRYPITFTGTSRNVELVTGEAYFEITHNAFQPFTVRVPAARQGDRDLVVDVLGTSFDLNNYPDEPATRATLITGTVRVTKGQETILLHPGDQAATDSSSDAITISRDLNVASVVAWKDGNFSFDRAGTEAIMRELARWYDVEVSYEGRIPARQFVGTIPRNVPASNVLKALELNNVHFRIEGKKIIVTP
jgi:ferric-dicitrate binding protein FerR (iron transport regulator)